VARKFPSAENVVYGGEISAVGEERASATSAKWLSRASF